MREIIVSGVMQKLNHITNPQIPHSLVGVKKQIKSIESLLCIKSTDVCIVGVWVSVALAGPPLQMFCLRNSHLNYNAVP